MGDPVILMLLIALAYLRDKCVVGEEDEKKKEEQKEIRMPPNFGMTGHQNSSHPHIVQSSSEPGSRVLILRSTLSISNDVW